MCLLSTYCVSGTGLGTEAADKTDKISVFPGSSVGQESACNEGGASSVPGWGRSPGGGDGNPLQYSCLKSPMDRGAWGATVHGVAKSQTRLSTRTHMGAGRRQIKQLRGPYQAELLRGNVKAAWGIGQTARVEDFGDLSPSPAPSPRHCPLRLLPSGQG